MAAHQEKKKKRHRTVNGTVEAAETHSAHPKGSRSDIAFFLYVVEFLHTAAHKFH